MKKLLHESDSGFVWFLCALCFALGSAWACIVFLLMQ